MKIRKAGLNDVGKISELNKEYFHEEGRNWNELIISKNSEMFVLENKKEIIGFTGLKNSDWNNTLHIVDIFVYPEHRKKGLGTIMIKYLLKLMKEKLKGLFII